MTYKQAIDYMYSRLPMFSRIGATAYKKDLERTLALCEMLNNPQNKLKFIHVAGTNGKGSVSHILASVFQEHGYKIGLYVSPHYKDFRERIKINGDYISKKYVRDFVENNKLNIERIEPSFFEMTVAMAFNYFVEQKVDYAIIETGLGGRLDSTNIIKPLLSVITNISWDHMDILGDTLTKISVEKAGIIKPNVPVVVGRKQIETIDVFRQQALKNKSKIFIAEESLINEEEEDKLCIKNGFKFNPSLKGPFQMENYNTALLACNVLTNESIIKLDSQKIKKAFEKVSELTNMIGRWQWLKSDQSILLDSAHNEDGLTFLCNWLEKQKYSNYHIVCGFVKDKDLSKVLNLLPQKAHYYFTQAKLPRALDSGELKNEALKFGLKGRNYKKVSNAFLAAKRKCQANDLIVVCGSIFVVAEVI